MFLWKEKSLTSQQTNLKFTIMKRTIFILLVFLNASLFGAEKNVKSTINEVVVFLNGAQVTRVANYTIPSGTHELIFKDVTPLLKKESIQVTGEGNFTILSVNHQISYDKQEPPKEEVAKLERQKREMEEKIEDLNLRLSVLNEEEALISNLKQINPNQKDFNIALVKEARLLIHAQMNEIRSEKKKVSKEVSAITEDLNLVKQKLSALSIKKSTASSDIVVKVSAKSTVNSSFKVSYYVNSVRWFPSYDLRVKNVESPMMVDYKANISQQTGEDWDGINLTLSTNDPNEGSQKPKLNAWRLYLNQNTVQRPQVSNNTRYTGTQYGSVTGMVTDEYGEPLPFANVLIVGTTVGTTTDFEGKFTLKLPPNASSVQVNYIGYKSVTYPINGNFLNLVLEENQVELEAFEVANFSIKNDKRAERKYEANAPSSTIQSYDIVSEKSKGRQKKYSPTKSIPVQVSKTENVVSVEFKLDEKYSIPSDAKSYTVNIEEINVPAYYQYYTAPKQDKGVFLTALLTNWDEYNFLEGQANVFFEGTYIGTNLLDVRFASDTLDVSLGRDKSIVVERKTLKEFKKKEFIGNEAIDVRKYEILVKNNKKQQINLMIEDQFPVSSDQRIEVKQEEKSGGKVDENTGIITWVLKTNAGKSDKVDFKYSVKYPKGNMVYLD